MKRIFALSLVMLSACASGPTLFNRAPKPNRAIEAQFARALEYLDPVNTRASLDSAVALLDMYLAHAGPTQRRAEAAALRRLAGSAQQLVKVEATLQQARASAAESRPRAADNAPRSSDPDLLKEIQRLKDELAEANAELERIRKRLATPRP